MFWSKRSRDKKTAEKLAYYEGKVKALTASVNRRGAATLTEINYLIEWSTKCERLKAKMENLKGVKNVLE